MEARNSSAGTAPSNFSPLMNNVGVALTPKAVASRTDACTASSFWAFTQDCSRARFRLCFCPCSRVAWSSVANASLGLLLSPTMAF